MELLVCNIGRSRYADAWKLQQELFNTRRENRVPDILLLTEHEHVYTFGKSSDKNHLLANEDELQKKNIDVLDVDRGGDITYHGPGQLVGYPILSLDERYHDIHRYLRDIEEVIIRTLSDFDIHGKRHPDFTGVWVDDEKIAAIGVKVSRWITMHGFALNVNTDLSLFDRIIPCGIFHKGVTSMEKFNGKSILMERVIKKIVDHFEETFNSSAEWIDAEELQNRLHIKKEIMI